VEILDSARKVFECKGFGDTSVSDIAHEANVSRGTFYTYFDTKEAVFAAVAEGVVGQMLESMRLVSIPSRELRERVHDSIRRFVSGYRPHATMLGLMEHAGTSSPAMRALRVEARENFLQRARKGIARMKIDGLTHPDLDVEYTAEALGSTLEFTCYLWFCLGRDFDEERMINTLATIWIKSLLRDQR
jgi:AcrR family transcriptional regulator